jgi:trk system potassium uptake protein TrkH
MRKSRAQTGALMRMPLFLLIWGIAALSMYVPAAFAVVQNDHPTSQSFFYAGTLGLTCVTMIAIALNARRPRYGSLGQLLSLFATFAVLPVFLAVPLHDALGTTTFFNAYFDMVSAITTTGANVFDDPTRLQSALHLWRAQVGWMGGLLMWVAAGAILAPLNLGGFEVTAQAQPGRTTAVPIRGEHADPRVRLLRITVTLAPIYVGLTCALWVLLLMAGDSSLIALCHAMSVMATSGISPVGGMDGSQSGVIGEVLLFLFMFFALSRLTFATDTANRGQARLDKDPEFRIGLLLVLGLPLLLLARHFLAAFDGEPVENVVIALQALWGSIFTVLSFLTTTGFVSADWDEAQRWSGLATPGLILMGLALIGGGVATTAGGVKLLRVYALYLNGLRELDRLVHPSSVSSADGRSQRIQKSGVFIAWVFFMLVALSIALISMILAGLGVSFENAMLLSVATLSTTGPLIDVAAETPIRLLEMSGWVKAVLCAAMVLGRLELLAIIALFTPDLWRE